MRIYLDMDGVLVDFVGRACEVHGKSVSDVTSWDFFADAWGMTADEFWSKINAEGRAFWADLDPLPWADELLELVTRYDPEFTICTMPSRDPECLAGKGDWLARKLGASFDRCIYARVKSDFAKPGRILIDDSDANITGSDKVLGWIPAGGHGVLFPQPWNALAALRRTGECPLQHVRRELAKLLPDR